MMKVLVSLHQLWILPFWFGLQLDLFLLLHLNVIKLIVAPPSYKIFRPIDGVVAERTLMSCRRQLSDHESFVCSVTVAAWNVIPSTCAWWSNSWWYISQVLSTVHFFRSVQSNDRCPTFKSDQQALFDFRSSTFLLDFSQRKLDNLT